MSVHSVSASLLLWLYLATVLSDNLTGLREIIPTIPKCCPQGESLVNKLGCKESNLTFIPKFLSLDNSTISEKINFLIGHNCKNGSYKLDPSEDKNDQFFICPNGTLLLPVTDTYFSSKDYCLESFVGKDNATVVLPVLCYQPPPTHNVLLSVYSICSWISIPFLIGTILILGVIGELQKLQGKVLSSYTTSLAAGYIGLIWIQLWGENLEQRFCITIAFMMQYFFLSSFFWLNILCFHNCRKINNSSVLQINKPGSKNMLFFFYSIYGYGLPLLILGISLAMHLMPIVPLTYVKSNFRKSTCWIENDIAILYYFYYPMSALFAINVIFFLFKITCIPRKQTGFLYFDAVYKFRTHISIHCVIFFSIIGMNWVLEVLSWHAGELTKLRIFVEIFNSLQGIIVFIMFVIYNAKVKELFWNILKFSNQVVMFENEPLKSIGG